MALGLRSMITIDGITASLADHASARGVSRNTLLSRMNRIGRSDALALLAPAEKTRKPMPPPSRHEVIECLMRSPAGHLATAKRLGDYGTRLYHPLSRTPLLPIVGGRLVILLPARLPAHRQHSDQRITT